MRYQDDSTAVINRVRDPFTRLFDSLFATPLPELVAAEFSPRTNIVETEQAYVLAFEVPGLEQQDIHVDLRENQLVITGERKDERETEGKTWHRVEHRYGTMTRTIALPPDAKTDGIEAVCKRGILTVTVPKLQPVQPTRIEVKAE